jgi:hypothetical protein
MGENKSPYNQPEDRYRGRHPEDVDISAGPVGSEHPIKHMTPEAETFYGALGNLPQPMPNDENSIKIINELVKLGLIRLHGGFGQTSTRFFSKVIQTDEYSIRHKRPYKRV